MERRVLFAPTPEAELPRGAHARDWDIRVRCQDEMILTP